MIWLNYHHLYDLWVLARAGSLRDASGELQLICREDRAERLLAELALHHLDVVVSDAARPRHVGVKAFNHLLGACDVMLNGHPDLVARYRDGAPGSLDGAPIARVAHDDIFSAPPPVAA